MKKVVSVSLGSSTRNHVVELTILGEPFRIERLGTDGDMGRAIRLIEELDGQVDAFGLGGTDLYLVAGERRYQLRDAARIARAAKKTPIVDGSGLKNTLERRVVSYLQQEAGLELKGRKVLVVSGVDRFGLSQALVAAGAEVTFGDLIFSLGIPIPLHSLKTLERLARILLPVLSQLPFKYLYPTGSKQEENKPKYAAYYLQADIVAGDFHFIRRYMPPKLPGKVIITNTVTGKDVEMLRERGIRTLVTTTPELEGRSFGTNVMEAVLVALTGNASDRMTSSEYEDLIERSGFRPRVEQLN